MTDRIQGPLKSWYDLHEALAHEVTGIGDAARTLDVDTVASFANRFWSFEHELRNHSEVEDGIMFPAIVDAGGTVDPALGEQHREEQLAVYALGAALLHAQAARTADAVAALVGPAAELRDSLLAHLALEEASVLTQVDGLFDVEAQAALFRSIIAALPPDPQLQPWVAAALTPAHLEARLRNVAASMPTPALTALMTQIHDGVDASVWAEVEARTPDLAALVTPSAPG